MTTPPETERAALVAEGLTEKAQAFMAANERSPVVYGSAQKRGGAYYRLKDGGTFRLTLAEVRSLPMPRWDFPAHLTTKDKADD